MNQSSEERLQQLLCAYVLNEVTDAERAEVEAALADSEELRAEKARFEGTIALVAGAYEGDEKLSAANVEALNVAASGGGKILYGPWYRKASVRAAAGLIVVVAAFGAIQMMEKDGEANRDDLVARYEKDTAPAESASTPAAVGEREDRSGVKFSIAPSPDPKEAPASVNEVDESLQRDFTHEEALGAVVLEAEQRQQDLLGKRTLELKDKLASTQTVVVDAPAAEFAAGSEKSAEVMLLTETPALEPVDMPRELTRGLTSPGGTYQGPGDSYPPGGGGGGATAQGAGPSAPVGGVSGSPGQPASPDARVAGGKVRNRLASEFKKSKSKKSPPGRAAATGASAPSSPGPAKASRPAASPSVPVTKKVVLERASLAELESIGYAGRENIPAAAGDEDLRLDFDRESADEFFLGGDDEEDADGRRGYYREGRVALRKLTPDEITAVTTERCDRIFRGCRRLPNESPRDMFYRYYGDNPFVMADLDALSTFAVDVDTSSYVLVRNYLKNRKLPTKAQVRTEEFVNYFRPDVPAPTEGVFNIATELAPSRFSGQPGRWMLRVALRGREVAREERKPLNLTFVTDTSGSMKEHNRMELVKHALRLLITQLDARDSISIIGFSNEARLVLPMTSAANRGVIESAIYGLQPDGGTNPEAGLLMGYEVAGNALAMNSHSRVVLLSDGVGNIGETDQDRITESVRHQRERGIYLNTIGVGMNNHNDEFLEQLANKGDGLSNYIDDELEARRALVENFTGAFEPIARDVKIQVKFDPKQVYRYRQLGYENRAIADADFRNDKVDAGEIGAGHQVVCLYELELDPSFTPEAGTSLATVSVRYKQPTGAGRQPLEDSATEIAHKVLSGSGTSFEGASAGYRRSVLAAQFAEILRRSTHARGDSLQDLMSASAKLAPEIRDPDFQEMLDLMTICRAEILKRNERRTQLGDRIDELRRHNLRVVEYEVLGAESDQVTTEDLEKLGQDLEQSIRDLIRRRIETEQAELVERR